jgi:shikimate dehydrogenase
VSRFAVVGDPVAHSKSPAMHAAAYRANGLPHTYEAIRATAEDLPRLVASLRDGTFDGLNVTVPHKQRVLDYVDAVDPSAAAVGAANTLVRAPDGRIVAHNTDVPALVGELKSLAPERTDDEWAGSRAIVLGTGGAARGAVIALAEHLGVAEIIVRGRDTSSFEASMRALFAARAPRTSLIAEPWRPSQHRERMVDTIVQATSAGMEGADSGEATKNVIAWSALPPSAIALEIIYAPPETAFLRAAADHHLRAANGFGMLARQGALAFELWLGLPSPLDAMRGALEIVASSTT